MDETPVSKSFLVLNTIANIIELFPKKWIVQIFPFHRSTEKNIQAFCRIFVNFIPNLGAIDIERGF